MNTITRKIDHWITGRRYLIISLVYLLFSAVLINLATQYRTITVPENAANGPISNCTDFVFEHPLEFAFGSLLLFFALLIFSAICGSAPIGAGVFFSFMILFTFVDRLKFVARFEHLLPGDLSFATNVGAMDGMYDKSDLWKQIVYIAVIMAFSILLTVLVSRRRKKICKNVECRSGLDIKAWRKLSTRRQRFIIRLLVAVLSASAIFVVTIDVRGDGIKNIPMIDYSYVGWNQQRNFARNGLVLGFISNFKKVGAEKPNGYSKEAVEAIVRKYENKAAAENKSRLDLAKENIDIVYVMNESFTEPDRFKDIYPYTSETGGALLPNLDALKKRAAYGNIYSPRYGGGTANIEFEGLTGMSTFLLGYAVPFQEILPKMETFPSVAEFLKNDYGYSTLGLHPYGAAMYRRSLVYPKLGFDAFHGDDEFEHTAHDGESLYISDASAYAEVEDYLNESKEKNNFITLITMQNHLRYGFQKHDHPFSSTAASGYEKAQIDDYMALLHDSDKALGDLVSWIDAREKKTVLVFWGDHLPGVYGNLLVNLEKKDLSYETPFIIYSNFEAEGAFTVAETDADAEASEPKGENIASTILMGPKEALGVLSPNYISTTTLDYIGAKKTPWDYLVGELKKKEPRYTKSFYGEDNFPKSAITDDYMMIEYDMISGERYAESLGLFDLD
ncbi:MAG: LTA synthase family protein [Clostridiales Family XIII bacterium]|nr:LTA synthase family protein [Clostridiales Family XIII bacterium]